VCFKFNSLQQPTYIALKLGTLVVDRTLFEICKQLLLRKPLTLKPNCVEKILDLSPNM
jgi:hypothetical protein